MPVWPFNRRRAVSSPRQRRPDRDSGSSRHQPTACPQARGEQEVRAWLGNGSSESLDAVLRVRDNATKSSRLVTPVAIPPDTAAEWPREPQGRHEEDLAMNIPRPMRRHEGNTGSSHHRSWDVDAPQGEDGAPKVGSRHGQNLTLIVPVTVYEMGPLTPAGSPIRRFSDSEVDYLRMGDASWGAVSHPAPASLESASYGQVLSASGPSKGIEEHNQGELPSHFSDESSDDDSSDDSQDSTAPEPSHANSIWQLVDEGQPDFSGEDPFADWSAAVAIANEPVDDQDYELDPTIPPFAPFSEEGQKRLRVIRFSLAMDLSTSPQAVQTFLGNNPSILRHLFHGSIPHPDRQYADDDALAGPAVYEVCISHPDSVRGKRAFWKAVTEVYWEDERIRRVIELALYSTSLRDEWLLREGYRKCRETQVSPAMYKRLMAEVPGFEEMERRKAEDKRLKRERRPHSILREVITLEDEKVKCG